MSSFAVVELHTVETERLRCFPGRERVLKARYQTIAGNGEVSSITPQKLRPFQALWTEELRQLKLNEKILEKYQSLEEFLTAVGGDSILIPGSPESAEILLDLQRSQTGSQAPQNQPPSIPGLAVLCLTPGIISAITGRMFQADTPMQVIERVLKEPTIMFEQVDVDLLDQEGAITERFFGDCDTKLDPSLGSCEPRFSLLEKQAGIKEYDSYRIESVTALLTMLREQFPERFKDVVYRITGRYDSGDFPSLAGQQAHEALQIKAEQMLSNKQLEQIGLKSTDFFDVRHAAPDQTYVKFYTKVSVGDKLQTCVDFYQQKQGIKVQTAPSGVVRLTGKPQVVEQFPPNPTFLLVRNVQAEINPGPFCGQVLQWVYKAFPQNYKKAADQCFCFKQYGCAQEVSAEVDRLVITQRGSVMDIAVLFPQADHENNRRIHGMLCDALSQYEWGIISEQQIAQMQRTRVWFRVEISDSLGAMPSSSLAQQQGQGAPYQQASAGYTPGYHPDSVPQRRDMLSNQPAPIQTPMQPTQTPLFSSKLQDGPEPKIMTVPLGQFKNVSTNARFLRSQAVGLQVHLLPPDAKIKDVAGFCKQQRVAEHMAWFLHQPFSGALGPIRLSAQYALLIFLSKEHAQQAEGILQTSLFKGQRILVKPAMEQDISYIDACFTAKDPPFLPCFCVVLKQIKLPQDHRELIEVVYEHWGQPKPEAARVLQDSGILYYKMNTDAERAFQGLRQLLFAQHQNDIFRIDYD